MTGQVGLMDKILRDHRLAEAVRGDDDRFIGHLRELANGHQGGAPQPGNGDEMSWR